MPTKGAKEFLLAVGFVETLRDGLQIGTRETYLAIPSETSINSAELQQAVKTLQTGVKIPLKLHRNIKVASVYLKMIIIL
jgi:hypothetical protein